MARTTLAMLLAFAVLGLGVLVLDKTQPAPSSDTTVYVLNVPDTDVQRLDVTTFGGSTAFERADPFGWKFASDGTQADLSRVSSVVNRLAKLRSNAKVTDNVGDPAPYGLSTPAITTTLTMKDGTKYTLLIGNETVNNAAYYAILQGHTDLHTIATLLEGDIAKLVSDPPVPTATPAASPIPVITTTPTPLTPFVTSTPTSAAGTPEPSPSSTPTIGLPAPSAGQ